MLAARLLALLRSTDAIAAVVVEMERQHKHRGHSEGE
jgi:hypothetical protein